MKVLWDYLTEADKKYMLAQLRLEEIFKELHRRANQDDDEDLEEEEEEEPELFNEGLRSISPSQLERRFPHEAEKLERLGLFTDFFRTTKKEVK